MHPGIFSVSPLLVRFWYSLSVIPNSYYFLYPYFLDFLF